jgi:hypothetical protein
MVIYKRYIQYNKVKKRMHSQDISNLYIRIEIGGYIMENGKIERTERGWAGHFIAADNCRFRRNTLLNNGKVSVVVSTVGNYVYQGNVEEIGVNRYYETMAFFSKVNDLQYHDADVSKQIHFNSPWEISTFTENSDNDANTMHDTVVLEIMHMMENKELIPQDDLDKTLASIDYIFEAAKRIWR